MDWCNRGNCNKNEAYALIFVQEWASGVKGETKAISGHRNANTCNSADQWKPSSLKTIAILFRCYVICRTESPVSLLFRSMKMQFQNKSEQEPSDCANPRNHLHNSKAVICGLMKSWRSDRARPFHLVPIIWIDIIIVEVIFITTG